MPDVKVGIVALVVTAVGVVVVTVAVAGALVRPTVVGTGRVGIVRAGTFVNVAGALVAAASFCRSSSSPFGVVAGALVALPGTGGAGGAFWARAADASRAKADVRERMRVFTIILKGRVCSSLGARVC